LINLMNNLNFEAMSQLRIFCGDFKISQCHPYSYNFHLVVSGRETPKSRLFACMVKWNLLQSFRASKLQKRRGGWSAGWSKCIAQREDEWRIYRDLMTKTNVKIIIRLVLFASSDQIPNVQYRQYKYRFPTKNAYAIPPSPDLMSFPISSLAKSYPHKIWLCSHSLTSSPSIHPELHENNRIFDHRPQRSN
jgi:hypothetical protein